MMHQQAEENIRVLEQQKYQLNSEVDKLTAIGEDKDRIIESKQKEINKYIEENKQVRILLYNIYI